MKQVVKFLSVLYLLVSSVYVHAQNITNKGKEFWVGYGHHQYMEPPCNGSSSTGPNDMNMVLYLSAEQAANVTVTIDSSGPFPAAWFRKTYAIPANTVISTENLPKGLVNSGPSASNPNYDARLFDDPPPAGFGGERIFRGKGIHIVSDVPIVAYAHIYGGVSSAATMLLPIESWGFAYTSVNSEQRDADRSYSLLYVVAKENNTLVEITPSAPSRLGKPAGVPFQVLLQKGQIYQYVAQSVCTTGNGPELTGSTVKSLPGPDGQCHAVAVFAGSSRTGGETLTCGTGSGRDNDMQQLFPEQAWGRRYLTAPFSKATSTTLQPSSFQTSVYKVIVNDPSTVVTRNGVALTGLIAGKYYKYSSNRTDYIQSDKPIMVAQFMSGTSACNGGDGDPEMVILSPIEQSIKSVGFYRNTRQAINSNYLTLIVPTAGVASLRIDNSAVFSHTYPHTYPGYTVVIKGWSSAQAQCLVRCDSAFTAITYGLGGAESYGYSAGTNLNNLNAVSSLHNVLDTTNGGNNAHTFTCTQTPVELSVLMRYQPTRLVWKLSTLAAVLTPNADFTMDPVSTYYEGTVIVDGVTFYKYTLPGTYSFNAQGTFVIPLSSTSVVLTNCNNTEELQISVEVKAKPTANFNFTHTGCTLDTVYFAGPLATTEGYTLTGWNWTFPGTVTSTFQNPKQVIAPGANQDVKLVVVTTDGCAAESTRQINVNPKPTADFTIDPALICTGNNVTLTPTANYATPASLNGWYWDFANGNTTTATSGTPQTPSYNAYGDHEVKLVVKYGNLCISDTVKKIVSVKAKPVINLSYPAGCLPASGVVQFTNNTSTPDGQAIGTHNWIFGDPNANAGNPNTSTLASPSHTYTAFGNYTINYSATSANGCVKDTQFVATFNLSPTFAYPALAPVCENAAAISVANATVTNAVPGTGVYVGPGTSTNGTFNPALAGAGTKRIWYVFTASSGCKDSIYQDIVVYPKPAPSFTYPNSGCLPATGQVQFTNTSTIPGGQPMTWSWNFGDANANAGNPNTSTLQNPTHNYLEGTYSIKLQATSSNGCVKDTTITTTFSLTPALNYAALPAICENAAAVSVATASVTNGASGTGVYSGAGTTPAGMFNPAIAGPGTHTITYNFTTTGGCTMPVTQTILVHGRPRPNFTFGGNGCLPTNGQVQFTNTSTIPDAQPMTWSWTFNDPNANAGNPNTSTAQNPTHNFGEGSYAIKLQATSSNGCIKDTTINAVFSLTPLLAYPVLNAVCESAPALSVATASATNAVTGTGVYSGPGTNAAGLFNPAQAGPGTHTITYTYTSTGGCVSTINRDILVHARPRPNFTFNNGCLSANGQAQFTNTSTIADGQAMTWSWNFNDPNANAGNPNTSTVQNPTHNYGEGTYAVNLQATSVNGCIKDTTINAVFKVTPALSFAPIPGICPNPGATPSSLAFGSVTNGVTGTGSYTGTATNAAGVFDPNLAGPGLHPITYTFISTGGCTESITSTVEVFPRPIASFTASNNGSVCLGDPVTLTSTASIAGGSLTNWNWTLGDGSTPSYTNGNPFTVTYTSASTFNVQLVAVSDKGCFSAPATQSVAVHPLPVANFNLPTGICMPNGNAVFNNQSSVSDNSALSYQWSFGDGGNSTATNPSYVYNSSGTYNVTLITTSAYGCADQETKVLDEFYDKPIAYFTVNAQELCQGDNNVFTDASTAPNSTVQSWSWNFGDNSSSSQSSPTKRFTQPGVYDVKLTVTNTVGCASDPYILPVTVHLQPVIDAGQSFVVPQGTMVQLTATANSTGLTFSWDPPNDLSDATVLRPLVMANQDRTYTLTATGDFGCTATDFITVKILKPVKVPNVFSPNGDNIHDRWEIPNLLDYPGATVEVFNRYGQQVYYSAGYGTPWDGTYKGKAMPVGTYYYIIQLQNGFKPMTGSLTIIR